MFGDPLTVAADHCAWARREGVSRFDLLRAVGMPRVGGEVITWAEVEEVLAFVWRQQQPRRAAA